MPAFYRKYRPRKFSDVLGQEENVAILKAAAIMGRLGHAYLFYGPRGTGKTTMARLIAMLANCEKRIHDPKFAALGEPCGECARCKEADGGNALDIIEIDAASNRGIDEIRNLKESIRVSPSVGKYKIYIIDEAHMLTGAAFNALLKTLEEPPAHAIIILATTEYEKIPSTISSRCQRFPFRRLPKSEIVKKLAAIVKNEGLVAEEAVLSIIASAAEGSLRDAESLLDQLSATGTLTASSAENILGRVGSKRVEELARYIAEKNITAAAHYISILENEGVNMTPFTKDLIHYLRKALTLRLSPASKEIIKEEHTDSEMQALESIAGKINEADAVRVLRALIRAYSEMRYSPLGSVPLEVVLTEQLT